MSDQNSTAVTVSPVQDLRQSLDKMQPQFALALPTHINPDKFVRVLMTAVQANPRLIEADRVSLYGACMKSAQDGLLPDGREAQLVIFGNQVQYMPMVAGVLKKVRNSGELLSIGAHVVCEADSFDYWIDDDGPHLKHRPNMLGDRGTPLAVYAIAKTKDGGVYVEVMNIQEIEKVRSVSRASGKGPWKDWWEEMAKKTAIRRLSKRLPMSTDAVDVVHRDDGFYDIDQTPNVQVAERKQGASRLRAMIDAVPTDAIDPPHTDEPDALPDDQPTDYQPTDDDQTPNPEQEQI